MVDTELVKGICAINRIPCAYPACVAQLDKYWLPTIYPSSQLRYAGVENCYYNKILEHYNDWIIMELLDNKTPQVEFDNIHTLSSNNTELVKLNGYSAISSNDDSQLIFTFLTLHLYHIHYKKIWNNM